MENSNIIWDVRSSGFSCIPLEEIYRTGKIVKSSSVRKVLEIHWEGEDYILKIFYAPHFLDRIRSWINPRPRREWKNLKALYEFRMPVPEPVALGHKGEEGYLVTKKIPQTTPLKEICKHSLSLGERRNISIGLARLTASLHNHGWIHNDFHSGNILSDQEGRLYLVDLYDISHFNHLNKKQAIQNLAMLGVSFALCATYMDFLVFLKEYFSLCTLFGGESFTSFFQKSNECFMDWFNFYCSKRAMRCIKENKYFQKISNPLGKGFAHKESILAIPPLPCSTPEGIALKNSRSTLVLKTPFGIWKEYRRKKSRNIFFDCFRKSRAQKAWIHGYNCILRGIPTAKPVFFQEKRLFFFLKSCYIVTEEIPCASIIPESLALWSKEEGTKEHKIILLKQLGKMLRTLHDRGMTHRDLKGNNLLVDQKGKIFLIDLDGLAIKRKVTQSRRFKDIKRLVKGLKLVEGVESKDMEILLKSYLPFAKTEEIKRWLETI